MYTFDQYFWLEIANSYTTKQSIIFFINQFCTFYLNMLCNDIIFMHSTHRPSMFSVLLQVKDMISENMKISKLLVEVGVFNIIFRKNEHGDLLFYQLVELTIKFPAIYVNIKKSIENKKNYRKRFQWFLHESICHEAINKQLTVTSNEN